MLARLLSMIAICSLLTACRGPVVEPVGTGAREVVMKYFEALVQQDWETAYAHLDADTQKVVDRATFERRALAYRNRLGFPLGKVFVRSCDEQGEKAVAQVLLSDANRSMKHRYHEGIVLKRQANGWGIVLPSNFAKP